MLNKKDLRKANFDRKKAIHKSYLEEVSKIDKNDVPENEEDILIDEEIVIEPEEVQDEEVQDEEVQDEEVQNDEAVIEPEEVQDEENENEQIKSVKETKTEKNK